MVRKIATSTVLLFGVILAPVSRAQYRQLDGTYSSSELDVRVIVLDSTKGAAAASAVLVSGACSASLAGLGQIRGHRLLVVPYEKVDGGESCKLTLQFDKSWENVQVTGSECAAFAGAACGFEGQSAVKRHER